MKNLSHYFPCLSVSNATTRVSFTSNRIWASEQTNECVSVQVCLRFGTFLFMWVLTSSIWTLATYLLLSLKPSKTHHIIRQIHCSLTKWYTPTPYTTIRCVNDGLNKKSYKNYKPIPCLCIVLWELARWATLLAKDFAFVGWWRWQRFQASRADKAMFINNHNVHSIERANMHLCALCYVHHNLKDYWEKKRNGVTNKTRNRHMHPSDG